MLSLISPRIRKSRLHTSKGSIVTIDDLLVHIAMVLNNGVVDNLVVAISGSPASIIDMTLTVVTDQHFLGMCFHASNLKPH